MIRDHSRISQMAMMAALLGAASAFDDSVIIEERPRGPKPRDPGLPLEPSPTEPVRWGKGSPEYEANAAAVREERARRKAEAWAKRQPKQEPAP